MPLFRIVKILDIVNDLGAGLFGRQLRVIEGQFAFDSAEERLRHGIVPAVPSSAHAANDPTGFQHGLILFTGIGTPSIRVVEETQGKSAALDCRFKCCQRQLSVVAVAQRIAHHPTGEQILYHREIEPAHNRPEVGDITHPALIRLTNLELAVEQICGHRQSVTGIGRAAELAPTPPNNASRTHQPGDPLAPDPVPSALSQLSVNQRAAAGPSAFLVYLPDLNCQFLVRTRTLRRPPLLERIIPAPGNLKERVKDSQWILGLLRAYEQKPHSLSFAKKAVAFFSMSRCICRRLFSRLSRTSSSRSVCIKAPGGLSSALISASRTHSRRAVSARSRFFAICAMFWPTARTSLTASALNSTVNCRLFLLVMFTFRRIIVPS
jgi:hypothetical protein